MLRIHSFLCGFALNLRFFLRGFHGTGKILLKGFVMHYRHFDATGSSKFFSKFSKTQIAA